MSRTKLIFGFVSLILFTGLGMSSRSGDSVTGVRIIDPQYAADFSNDKVLVGASQNIFIGKIIKQIGDKENGIGPETQFKVEVIDNIKGNLKGTVTVDQVGGYSDGILYAIGDDVSSPMRGINYLLQPGSTYLLATRYNDTEDWYTLNSYPTASKLLSSNSGLNDAELKTIAQNDNRVNELKVAYPNEILLDADVKHNNIQNRYKSLVSGVPAADSAK